MKSFGAARKGLVCILALVCSAGAVAEEPVYQCGETDKQQDIRVTPADWFSRPSAAPGDSMKPKGCNSDRTEGGYRTEVTCSSSGGIHRAVTRVSEGAEPAFQFEEILDTNAMELIVAAPGSFTPDERKCVLVGAPSVHGDVPIPSAASVEQQNLAEQIAAGRPFLIITDQDALQLKRNGWYYPSSTWVLFEGRYHSDKGLWAVTGVGFSPRGNPLHSCPKEIRCGGVHEEGFPLARWVRPEDHELVAFGRVLTFDEAGNLFRDGSRVGQLIVPEL